MGEGMEYFQSDRTSKEKIYTPAFCFSNELQRVNQLLATTFNTNVINRPYNGNQKLEKIFHSI